MRRDMDLIRELMLRLEDLKIPGMGVTTVQPGAHGFAVEGHSRDEVAYHLDQIKLSGFIEQGSMRPAYGIGFRCLTPKGHDFIDSVREPKVWTETKTRAEKVGGWTVGILTDIAKGYLKAKAAEHGIPLG